MKKLSLTPFFCLIDSGLEEAPQVAKSGSRGREIKEAVSDSNDAIRVDTHCFNEEDRTENCDSLFITYFVLKAFMKEKIELSSLTEYFGYLFINDTVFNHFYNNFMKSDLYKSVKMFLEKEVFDKYNHLESAFKDDTERQKQLIEKREKELRGISEINIKSEFCIFKQIVCYMTDFYCYDIKKMKKESDFLMEYHNKISEKVKNTYFYKRFESLQNELKLNNTEIEFLKYIFIFPHFPCSFYYNLLGIKKEKLEKINNKFEKMGLVHRYRFCPILAAFMQYTFKKHNLSELIFSSNENKKKRNTCLTCDDYDENLQEDIKYITKLIKNHNGNSPLNILFYGNSGSGKSSLSKILENSIKEKIFFEIRKNIEINIYDDSLTPEPNEQNIAKKRMENLKACNSVAVKNKFVFIMDESDDVLNSSYGVSDGWLTGKKEINELLQDMTVPTIWITNHKNRMDASTFRRFQYVVKFGKLTTKQREKVWKRQIEINKASKYFCDINLYELSSKYEVSAGIINNVVEQVISLKPNKDETLRICNRLLKSYFDLEEKEETEEVNKAENEKYDISGLNIESNFKLEQVLESLNKFSEKLELKKNKNKNLNVLLEGNPGTGKTEFAKYISRYLKKPLIYKNYGDLASCWVGETEHNIAKIFKEAEETGSVLFLDEADSLFSSRENARASWEVTQVNEIITRMERFNGIFIASTNFLENLDKASLRRFAFKIKFKDLDNEGKVVFLKRFFDIESKDYSELYNIKNLTPGDYKVVRDKFAYLDVKPDYHSIVNELKEETKYKNQVGKVIGFAK